MKITEQSILDFFNSLSRGTRARIATETAIIRNDIYWNGTCGGTYSTPKEIIKILDLLGDCQAENRVNFHAEMME
jgi:hypothetical protein